MFKNSLHCATLYECNAQLSKYAKPLVYRPLLRGLKNLQVKKTLLNCCLIVNVGLSRFSDVFFKRIG